MLKTPDVFKSTSLYMDVLGFEDTGDYAGHPDGKVLKLNDAILVLIPTDADSPSNPFHFALEVSDQKKFRKSFEDLESLDYNPRSNPQLESSKRLSKIELAGVSYQKFYFNDPAGTLVEIMCRDEL